MNDQTLGDATVRDYAAGRLSWRQIREDTGVEDFNLMLDALGRLGLKLPKADPERPSQAKAWMDQILQNRGRAA